jgi:poly-gamma-glutamate synthesis protein (capsule biosynthesis protein)
VAERALEADDFARPYRAAADVLRAADLTIGSLDGALSDLSPPIACGRMDEYNLIGPSRMAEGLGFAGFDLITVATNHILDCGSYGFGCQGRALVDTLAALRAQGIEPVGAGADVAEAREVRVFERGGQRIAFLGLTAVVPDTWAAQGRPGAAPLSPAHLPTVLAEIGAARARAEIVVVLVHWGVEYADAPTAEQRDWARQMIAAGATLVVGNHPHVIQPVEALGDGLVAYSLGNFVFDQEPPDTRRGLVLEVTIESGAVLTWRTLPVRIEQLFQPVWEEVD